MHQIMPNGGASQENCIKHIAPATGFFPCKPTSLTRNGFIGFDQFGGMESAIIPA
jgi:hypothetical protein